jgi:hypothetical protein
MYNNSGQLWKAAQTDKMLYAEKIAVVDEKRLVLT